MEARKVIPVILIVGGAAVVARKFGPRMESSMDWGQMIERMPDDAPPKWMLNTLTALREEHERILQHNEQILDRLNRLSEEHTQLLGPRETDEKGDD
jgi:hypothetical protein